MGKFEFNYKRHRFTELSLIKVEDVGSVRRSRSDDEKKKKSKRKKKKRKPSA